MGTCTGGRPAGGNPMETGGGAPTGLLGGIIKGGELTLGGGTIEPVLIKAGGRVTGGGDFGDGTESRGAIGIGGKSIGGGISRGAIGIGGSLAGIITAGALATGPIGPYSSKLLRPEEAGAGGA